MGLRRRQVREPLLSDRELRILRGMIDEYDFHHRRARARAELWSGASGILLKTLTALAALAVVASAVKGLMF